jgi:hypothetical protein
MRQLSTAMRRETTESHRTLVRADEQMFGDVLSDIASRLWPDNTAANVAAQAGCSVRAVEYYLAGQRDWSSDALAAIVSEILTRHKMRNVRVEAHPQSPVREGKRAQVQQLAAG